MRPGSQFGNLACGGHTRSRRAPETRRLLKIVPSESRRPRPKTAHFVVSVTTDTLSAGHGPRD